MLLAIDIGNTQIVVGVFAGENLAAHWRIATNRAATEDEYGSLLCSLFAHTGLAPAQVEGVIISSVVPPLNEVFQTLAGKYFGVRRPLLVGPGLRTGLTIKYENPKEVGADRIVNAVAAYAAYGGPVLIVDSGTATTFCAVSAAAEYLGGVIVPGIGIAADALSQRAAKLPRVELVRPPRVLGKNTVSSIQSGLFYGFVGQVDTIVTRLQAELGWEGCSVVATGGLAGLLRGESRTITHWEPLLTLQGLLLLYQRNAPAR